MSAIARYGKAVTHPGQGGEPASILLAAADAMADLPGCELYLVSQQKGEPDTVWVTELCGAGRGDRPPARRALG